MGTLLHLPHGIKEGWGSLQCTKEGNSHLGKNRTPHAQSKRVHEGSSFKGVHLKNSSTAGPSYWWGAEPSVSSPEKSQHTNIKSSNLTVFVVPLWQGGRNSMCQFKGCSQALKFHVKNTVMIYRIHCVHHTNPQHKITAALLQIFPLGTQGKCILKGQK